MRKAPKANKPNLNQQVTQRGKAEVGSGVCPPEAASYSLPWAPTFRPHPLVSSCHWLVKKTLPSSQAGRQYCDPGKVHV